ncbi:MAG: LysM peptidoglycan-binding domain-containing protein [Verrucomicrobiota bacterium]|nr:LysM peptidoglycan-binding domain-containing protein [Verrucomicrobiota bacterium]
MLTIRTSALLALLALAGCDRMFTPQNAQRIKDAEARVIAGDYPRAISLYESALADTSSDAEVHYRLGLLYDDKMNDAFDAAHHFRRYLALSPNGKHAGEVKNLLKRDEISLLTSLSGDAVITRSEATRLRNENLSLRHDLEEAKRNHGEVASKPTKSSDGKSSTYVVKKGDTFASISRKFYKTSARWKTIQKANPKINPTRLEPGETLTIPSR